MGSSYNGISDALSPAISICTILVSIGPYITQYYFSVILLLVIMLIAIMEYRKSIGRKALKLPACYYNQQSFDMSCKRKASNSTTLTKIVSPATKTIFPRTKQVLSSTPRVSEIQETASSSNHKRIAKLRENFSKSKEKSISSSLDSQVSDNDIGNFAISTVEKKPVESNRTTTNFGIDIEASRNRDKKRYSDSFLIKPRKKLALLKSKLGKSYHISMMENTK